MRDQSDDPVLAAVFQESTRLRMENMAKQIDLLWRHNAKRREEIAAIKSRIDSALVAVLVLVCGLLFKLIGPKLGF